MVKKFNWFLVMVMIFGTVFYGIFNYQASRILTYLAIFPVLLMPVIFKNTKYRFRDWELLFYYLFIFLADFLGCVLNLYNIVSWYDLLVHFISGIFSFGVGLAVLNRTSIKGRNVLFDIIFCMCTVMFIAGVWELFEYGVDIVLGYDLQHHLDTGVMDTMEDMLAAFLGGIVGSCGYLFYKRK